MLADLPGRVAVLTMEEPWNLVRAALPWEPDSLCMPADMELSTLEALERDLPECDVVVGVGGGSSCDAAKFVAWKRACRMVLVPTIVSVDAMLTNSIAVRVDGTVRYVGDIVPEELLVDYDLIQQAPPHLNRAGAADMASIHTALWDWRHAHERNGECYDPDAAAEAERLLAELDRNADDIFRVTPRGIDTLIDLFRREVELCARVGSSRPEEGSEHIVAYHMERMTGRHFVHGDLVGLGIFTMSRLQGNRPEWADDLMRRLGVRFGCPDARPGEIERCLRTLNDFNAGVRLFFNVLDSAGIDDGFVADTLDALGRAAGAL